jgi:hypothetical protein
MSRSRPTKSEKNKVDRINLAGQRVERAEKALQAAELAGDPDVALKRDDLVEARKRFQEAYDDRPGYARR